MVKTLRIINHDLHTELLKIQGELQAKSGVYTTMDDVVGELIKTYRKHSK